MNTHRILIASAALFAVLATTAHAQGTQPPAGGNPDRICEYDSNTGTIGLRYVPAGEGNNLPRGIATEGNPTQSDNGVCQQTAQDTPVPTVAATPVPTVPVPTSTATPAPGEPTPTPTTEPTATPTAQPTWTPVPEATATPEPTWTPEPEPTVPPLEPCVRGPNGQPLKEPCGIKG